jgi:two-component system, OmpR family, response regulator
MNDVPKIKLFLVDDDALYLKALEIEFLLHGDFTIHTFATGELCLAQLGLGPDLIVLDYHLDGMERDAMDGLRTLDRIKALAPKVPVIMLSSQDKIEVAVNCMHHHALDYIVKSETAFLRLQKSITQWFQLQEVEKALHWYMDKS